MRLTTLLLILALPARAQTAEEAAYVRAMFAQVQELSFRKGVEVCGFIGYGRDGGLAHSGPHLGEYAGCTMDWPNDLTVVASYHTHGVFDAAYIAELPSDRDMMSDQAMGVNGWIATPGGRLWYIDSVRMVTRQVCSVGCLPVAEGFYSAHSGPVAKDYTFDQLLARLAG